MLVVDDKHGSNDFNESEVDDIVSDLWKKTAKGKVRHGIVRGGVEEGGVRWRDRPNIITCASLKQYICNTLIYSLLVLF